MFSPPTTEITNRRGDDTSYIRLVVCLSTDRQEIFCDRTGFKLGTVTPTVAVTAYDSNSGSCSGSSSKGSLIASLLPRTSLVVAGVVILYQTYSLPLYR